MKTTLSVFTAIIVVCTAGTASAAIIFDDFSGVSTTPLEGTTADTGGVWSGSDEAPESDGSIVGLSNARNVYQAVNLEVGNIYELSMDISLVDSGNNNGFMGIGFSLDNQDTGPKNGDNAVAMMNVNRLSKDSSDGTVDDIVEGGLFVFADNDDTYGSLTSRRRCQGGSIRHCQYRAQFD
jgi:hypothetical protein